MRRHRDIRTGTDRALVLAVTVLASVASCRADDVVLPPLEPSAVPSSVSESGLEEFDFEIPENAEPGTVVGRVPVERGFLFVITGGNDDGAFAIDHRTGELRLNRANVLDHESRPRVALDVEVTSNWPANDLASWRFHVRLLERKRDLASVVPRRTVRAVIDVTNVDEPPVVNDVRFETTADAKGSFGRVTALDAEDGNATKLRLVGDTPFAIAKSGEISWRGTERPALVRPRTYEFEVEAEDAAGAVSRGRVAVLVSPSNAVLDELTSKAESNSGEWLDWFSENVVPADPTAGHTVEELLEVAATIPVPSPAALSTESPIGDRPDLASAAVAGIPGARSSNDAESDGERRGFRWEFILVAVGGTITGLVLSSGAARRRIRSIRNGHREQLSEVEGVAERTRERAESAEQDLGTVTDEWKTALRDLDVATQEREEVERRLETLQAEYEELERTAALAATEPAPTEGLPDFDDVSKTATFDRTEEGRESDPETDAEYEDPFDAATTPVVPKSEADADTESESDWTFFDANDTTPGTPEAEVDPFSSPWTEKSDASSFVAADAGPAENAPDDRLAEVRGYLAQQFEMDTLVAESSRSGEAVAQETAAAVEATRVESTEEVEANETEHSPIDDIAIAMFDEPEPEPGPVIEEEQEEEVDQYSSVEAYMSRLLGKSAKPESTTPIAEPQADKLAEITETAGVALPATEAAEVEPTVPAEPPKPVHQVDQEKEREKIQCLRTVAQGAARQALDTFQNRSRGQRDLRALLLLGLVAAVSLACWLLFT